MKLQNRFLAARRVSAPLVAVATPDPATTIATLTAESKTPALTWDITRGARAINRPGVKALNAAFGEEAASLTDPTTMLDRAARLPKDTMLFVMNGHRYLEGPGSEAVVQAVWNLRDPYKADTRTLVLLGPSFRLPPELMQDVLLLEEELPDGAQLRRVVASQYEAAQLPPPDDAVLDKAVDALRGLAAFPAEQVTAMSLTRKGLDAGALWERKRQIIEQTPGLSVNRSGETYDDIGGIENAKQFGRRILSGNDRPRGIVFVDEIEKAMAGATGAGDSSGVSQSLLGTVLTYMQDRQATGLLCIGPPGGAKSMFAKATGNTGGIPTIALDLASMKGPLVGQSEHNLRQALKVVSAVADDRALWIATCNSIAVLPPELRRRFGFGTFFFDLPTAEERKTIWGIYLRKYRLEEQPLPDNDGWTGAEIRVCCDLSWRLRCSLVEAAAFIVPVARSAVQQIEQLRSQASGRFISASFPGVYRCERTSDGRAISMEGN
ncbi:MAG: hypothetical protein JXB32_14765 [Deltaproteobacteria bacterium]|nr:hypothetical protein [Deltaproteobacteria bacterium]